MKNTVTEYQFIDSFPNSYKDNFSYEGKKALYEYLTQLENDCDMELELDPTAFCCEYSEYEGIQEFKDDYGVRYNSISDIRDCTQVIMINDYSFIIQNF